MISIKYYFTKLKTVDLIVVVFSLFLNVLNLLFLDRIKYWHFFILLNTLIIVYVFISAYFDSKKKTLLWRHLHLWYLVPLILIFFKELYFMIDPIRGIIIDETLIKIDRFIFFGNDPTVLLYKIANPYLTELLQIVYGTFYLLPVILGIDLMLKKKQIEFDFSAFIIVYGFFLSFIGYLLFPAIGPRFTLHNFEMNNFEMPGLLLTDFLREIVNSGESIPYGTLNPAKIVQRDAFPSGHTQMTLLVMFLAVKFNSRLKLFFLINGSLLIFATVYLRYHYVVDLIAGLAFMIFTLWSGKYIYNWRIGIKEKK